MDGQRGQGKLPQARDTDAEHTSHRGLSPAAWALGQLSSAFTVALHLSRGHKGALPEARPSQAPLPHSAQQQFCPWLLFVL